MDSTWFDGVTWVDVSRDEEKSKQNPSCGMINAAKKSKMTLPCYKSIENADHPLLKSRKRRRTSNEAVEGMFESLPTEIVSDILSRLPAEDILQCRMVCSSWYGLTKDPHFVDMHLSRALCRKPNILIRSSYNRLESDWLSIKIDIMNGKCCSTKVPIWTGGKNWEVRDSCNGLLCLSDGGGTMICNPTTKECLKLPNSFLKPLPRGIRGYPGKVILRLGFDSVNKKYKVVQVYTGYIVGEKRVVTIGKIITLGENSWRKLDFPRVVCTRGKLHSVFQNGAFHWLITTRGRRSPLEKVLVLDIVTEKFHVIAFPSSVGQTGYLRLTKFGDSVALIDTSGLQNGSVQIWKIVGSRINGGRIHQRIFGGLCNLFGRIFKVEDMLSDSYMLFITPKGMGCDHGTPNFFHLVIYNPEDGKGFCIHGISQRSSRTTPFVPSLVSPLSLSS